MAPPPPPPSAGTACRAHSGIPVSARCALVVVIVCSACDKLRWRQGVWCDAGCDSASLARREALFEYGVSFRAHPGKRASADIRISEDFLDHVRLKEWRDHRDKGMVYSIYERTLGRWIMGYFKEKDPDDSKPAAWYRRHTKAILWAAMCKCGDQYCTAHDDKRATDAITVIARAPPAHGSAADCDLRARRTRPPKLCLVGRVHNSGTNQLSCAQVAM